MNLCTKNRSTRPSGIWSPGSLCEQEETKYAPSYGKYQNSRNASSPEVFSRPDSTGTGLEILSNNGREVGRRCSSSGSWDTEPENVSITTSIFNGKGDIIIGKVGGNGKCGIGGERSFQVCKLNIFKNFIITKHIRVH